MSATTQERTAPERTGHAQRDDIQGLRAVAVLTVIAAHAGLGLSGGYVGVDVFFVVSGLLISSLLYREVARTGRLSITGFYARRARRILPAATVVSVATLLASVLFLSLIESLQVVRDTVWSALFAANIHFAFLETDYFAQDQGPSPLQHYWSLAVEEQYYLGWPLILIGCLWWARRRHAGAGLPKRVVAVVLTVLVVASLTYSIWFTSANASGAYFSTLARIWELGLGALLALLLPVLTPRLAPALRSVLAVGGLLAIAMACTTYTPTTLFPGYAALLPVLGTVAVLLAGAGLTGPAPLPVRVLGAAPLRAVGDWSYSLYLWHWPLLIIPERYLGRELRPLETAALLVLVFVLSWASYRWVESPFRTARGLSAPRALVLYPLSLALVAVTCIGSWSWIENSAGALGDHPAITLTNFGVEDESAFDLAEDPAVALVQASVIAARHHMAIPSALHPDLLALRDDNPSMGACDYSRGSTSLCAMGDTGAGRTLVVLGDSHGRMWIPALDAYGAEHGWKAYFLVKPHCTAAHMLTDENGDGRPWTSCTDFHGWVTDRLAELDPDLVVVSTGLFSHHAWDGGKHLTSDADVARLAETKGFPALFEAVRPLTDRLVLLRDIPSRGGDPGTCLTTGTPDLRACAFKPVRRSVRMADASEAAAKALGIEVVDPLKWVCWEGLCPAVIGDVISYRDVSHISATYARRLADPLGEALGLDR